MFPMLWRFFPTLDHQVDYFLSRYQMKSVKILKILFRDLDSKMIAREAAAVSEFVESGAAIHAMRDHPKHKRPLMGCSWGASLVSGEVRNMWVTAWERMMRDDLIQTPHTGYQADQTLLTQYVWPWGRNISLQHDSYLCNQFPGSISFPTKRKDEDFNFVGARAFTNSPLRKIRVWEVCPEECRRNKEWEHC